MERYPNEILAMLEQKGFMDKFYKYRNKASTDKEAYEWVEKLYKKYFGRRKYKDYESFKGTKNQAISKHRNSLR